MEGYGRVITPNFELPEGFELRENSNFLNLLYKERLVSTFHNGSIYPLIILSVCYRFLEENHLEGGGE